MFVHELYKQDEREESREEAWEIARKRMYIFTTVGSS
jgi:hypothetical protein